MSLSLYRETSIYKTNDFLGYPSNSKIYEKKNLGITKPRHSEQFLPVPWPFVISTFHCICILSPSLASPTCICDTLPYIILIFIFLIKVSFSGAVVLFCFCVVTFTLNATVILVIWKDPYKELRQTAANFLILNLAVCDSLVALTSEILLGLLHWFPDDHSLKHAAYTFTSAAFFASILTMACLAVERLIVIASSSTMAHFTSCKRVLVFLTIWLLAGILALPPVTGWEFFEKHHVFYIADIICIPITIIVFACYTRIYFLVRRHLHLDITTSQERLLEGQPLTENSRLMQKVKMKERSVAFTVFILVLLFTVCWIPVSIVSTINKFCNSSDYESAMYYTGYLVFLQPLLNPIVYSLRTAKFQKALWRVVKRTIYHWQETVQKVMDL